MKFMNESKFWDEYRRPFFADRFGIHWHESGRHCRSLFLYLCKSRDLSKATICNAKPE